MKDEVGVRFHVDLNKGYFAFLAYSYAKPRYLFKLMQNFENEVRGQLKEFMPIKISEKQRKSALFLKKNHFHIENVEYKISFWTSKKE